MGSAVTINAGAVAQTGNITAIRAYIDDQPKFLVNNPAATNHFQVFQDINVDAGSHHLVVVGYQDNGGAVTAELFFTSVTAAFADCIPGQPIAVFCRPGGIIVSPIQVSAGVGAVNGYVTAIRLYVDGVSQLTVMNPQPSRFFAMDEPLAIPPDLDPSVSHTITLVGYDSTGGAVTANQVFDHAGFNPPQTCPAPGSPGVNVCSPQPGVCTVNGTHWILAKGTGNGSAVDHMELWEDSSKVAEFPGNSINTNIGVSGTVTLTVIVVDVDGQSFSSAPITVFVC